MYPWLRIADADRSFSLGSSIFKSVETSFLWFVIFFLTLHEESQVHIYVILQYAAGQDGGFEHANRTAVEQHSEELHSHGNPNVQLELCVFCY